MEKRSNYHAFKPLQFGVRTLLLLMGVLGVQFALIYYFGSVVGLVVGFAVCAAIFAAIFFGSIALRPDPTTETSRRVDQLAIWLCVALLVLVAATMLAGAGDAMWRLHVEFENRQSAEQLYGAEFREDTFYDSYYVTSHLVIDSVAPGGKFDRLGVVAGEVIVCEDSPQATLSKLASAGDPFELEVATPLRAYDIDGASRRKITIDPEN